MPTTKRRSATTPLCSYNCDTALRRATAQHRLCEAVGAVGSIPIPSGTAHALDSRALPHHMVGCATSAWARKKGSAGDCTSRPAPITSVCTVATMLSEAPTHAKTASAVNMSRLWPNSPTLQPPRTPQPCPVCFTESSPATHIDSAVAYRQAVAAGENNKGKKNCSFFVAAE